MLKIISFDSLPVCVQVDGMNVVREDGDTNVAYVFFLMSYVVVVNWVLLQVVTELK